MATCERCGEYETPGGLCSNLRCYLGVSPTARVTRVEPDYSADYGEFYRPERAPIPRTEPSTWSLLTERETWVVIAGALAGIVAALAIIWVVLVVGFTLTEH